MEWNTNTAEWFESVCCFLQLLYFISFAQQPAGQVAKHHNSATIQCAGAGRDNLYLNLFTAAKTVLGNFLINLESILSLGLFLLRNQRNILVCKKCFFPWEQTEDSGQNISFARMFSHGWESRLQALLNLLYTLFPTLGRTSRLQECSALVESLICKHFSTFLIPCFLQKMI